MKHLKVFPFIFVLGFLFVFQSVQAEPIITKSHAIALQGEPKYGLEAAHLDYANPKAPKGGELREAVIGTFDTVNPFLVKGSAANGYPNVFDSLMSRVWDEPFSLYGLIAETIEYPDDYKWVQFNLRPEARFHDGTPITADDVIFSFETLRDKGKPRYRTLYEGIDSEKIDDHTVKFTMNDKANREAVMIMGLLTVLSKEFFATHDFEEAGLDPILGNGPYKIAKLEPGQYIAYERVKDYWGKDLMQNRGHFNFDQVRYDYFRDGTVALEAFKKGDLNFRRESDPNKWFNDYKGPAFSKGDIVKANIKHQRPSGLKAFAFNTRRDMFKDPRVRQALAMAFDSDWVNKNLFYGAYKPIESLFDNSDMAPFVPPSEPEKQLTAPFKNQLPAGYFDQAWFDKDKGHRQSLRKAQNLLKEAGWVIKDNHRVNEKTGKPLVFEVLLNNQKDEKLALTLAKNLESLGVQTKVKIVDSANYQERINNFDYDVILNNWIVTLTPGAEQRNYWGTEAANKEGSRNYTGVQDKVVDTMIDYMTEAKDREEFITAAKSLARTLAWGYYGIPLFYNDTDWIAHSKDLHYRQDFTPVYGTVIEAWWHVKDSR